MPTYPILNLYTKGEKMKITIKEKKDLEEYLKQNLSIYFNAFYNGKHLCFDNKTCFIITLN